MVQICYIRECIHRSRPHFCCKDVRVTPPYLWIRTCGSYISVLTTCGYIGVTGVPSETPDNYWSLQRYNY